MTKFNKISIIVSTYNQPEYLYLTLLSLANQKNINYEKCEVIVADDGSDSETTTLIRQFQEKYPCVLLHVWHPDNGFQKAVILNKAVAKSSGDYLLFIDGDCVVDTDFIVNQQKLAEHNYFIAGNRVLLSEKFTREVIKQKINLQNKTPLDWLVLAITKKTNKFLHWIRLSSTGSWRKSRNSNWKYPKGCNIAIWKKDYISVNGYDESYVGWGHEDADLFIRLLHNNILIKDGRFSVPVYHLWHKFNSRENEKENYLRLTKRALDLSITYAVNGVNQYI